MNSRDIIDRIKRQLAEGEKSEPPFELAQQYVDACERTSAKLALVVQMAEAGSSLQAIETAQASPRLWDGLEVLSGSFRPAWRSLCRKHGLPNVESFDSGQLNALNRLFSKDAGKTTEYYREFRAAMMSRDEEQAFKVLEVICALDPEDKNASQEYERLRRKRVKELTLHLEQSLTEQSDADVVENLAKLEHAASADDLEDSPVYDAAIEKRFAIRRAKCMDAIYDIAGKWGTAAPAEGWLVISGEVLTVEGDRQELQPEVSESVLSQYLSVVENIRAAHKEALAEQRFTEAVEQLEDKLEESEELLSRRSKTEPGELIGAKERLERVWAHVQSFAKPLEDQLERRTRSTVPRLLAAVEGHERRKRLKMAAIAATVTILVVSTAALGFLSFKTRSEARKFNELVSAGQAETLKTFIAETRTPMSWVPFTTEWQANKSAAEDYLSTNERLRNEAVARIDGAAKRINGDLDEKDFTGIWKELEEATPMVDRLPTEWKMAEKTRLDQAKSDLQIQSTDLKMRLIAESSDAFAAVEDAIDACRQQMLGPDELRERDELIRASMAKLKLLSSGDVNPLRGSDKDLEDYNRLAEEVRLLSDDLRALAQSRVDLSAAGSWEQYWDELRQISSLTGLTKTKECAAASSLLSLVPTMDDLLNRAIYPETQILMELVRHGSGFNFFPEGPFLPAEASIYLDVRDNEFLLGVSIVKIKKKTYLAQPRELPKNGYVSVQLYNPSGGRVINIFEESSIYEDDFSDEKLTPVSLWLSEEGLERMIDDDGERFDHSALNILSRLFKACGKFQPGVSLDEQVGVHPLAGAWIALRMMTLIELRSAEWGLPLVPELTADIDSLKEIFGDGLRPEANSWIIHGSKEDDKLAKLTQFFKDKQSSEYLHWADFRHTAAFEIVEDGLVYIGHCPAAGTELDFNGSKDRPIWGVGTNGSIVKAYEFNSLDEWVAVNETMPLSPLFQLAKPREEYVSDAARAARVGQMPDELFLPLVLRE